MGKVMWHLILKDGLPFKPFRKKDLNTTSATTVHEEVAVDPSSDQKVPTIRSLTEALAQRTNDAQTTAATISRMPVVDD